MAHENLPWSLIDGRERADDPRFWPAAELSEASFEGALIVDVDLSAAELLDATFEECTLARVDLRDGQVQGATFRNCVIYRCDMRRAQFENVTFENVLFDRCILSNSNFAHSSGTDVTFARCEAPETDFSGATLAGRFHMTDLESANFDDATLDECTVVRCHILDTTPPTGLEQCVAEGITAADRTDDENAPWFLVTGTRAEEPGDGDLDDTFFFEAELGSADFSGRTLRDTHFVRCQLDEANFTGATLDNVWFWDCDLPHLNLAASTSPRVTLMHSRGAIDAAGATFEALHIEQGFHPESNLEAATIVVGSVNMTDMRGSSFKGANLRVESYMTDYMGCDFEGTDLGGFATERSHFDDGTESATMADSVLRGIDDAGEVVGGVELRRIIGAIDDEPASDVDEENEVSEASEASEASEVGEVSEASEASDGDARDHDPSDADSDDADEELDEPEDEADDDGAGDEDSDADDSEESEPKVASETSKKESKETAIAKKSDEPKGFFSRIIAFFKSLFGG